jgi:hypothetical protein
MVLTAYLVLSPVTGLSCHRRPRWNCFLRKLDTSVGVSGPHDFAVREPARTSARCRVHRIPHPTFVTIAIRPSSGVGLICSIAVSTKSRSEIFFESGLDTILRDVPVGQITLRFFTSPRLRGERRPPPAAVLENAEAKPRLWPAAQAVRRVRGTFRQAQYGEAAHPNPLPVKNGERGSTAAALTRSAGSMAARFR